MQPSPDYGEQSYRVLVLCESREGSRLRNDQAQIVVRVAPQSIHPTLKTGLKAAVVAPQVSLSA